MVIPNPINFQTRPCVMFCVLLSINLMKPIIISAESNFICPTRCDIAVAERRTLTILTTVCAKRIHLTVAAFAKCRRVVWSLIPHFNTSAKLTAHFHNFNIIDGDSSPQKNSKVSSKKNSAIKCEIQWFIVWVKL